MWSIFCEPEHGCISIFEIGLHYAPENATLKFNLLSKSVTFFFFFYQFIVNCYVVC